MIRHSKHHHIDSAIIYGFAVLAVIALSHVENIIGHLEQKISPSAPVQVKEVSMYKKDAFSKVRIQGKSYVVYDIVTGKVIAGKNENTVRPLASVTKVMTVLTARTHYDKNKRITITPGSIDGAYDLGLHKGQVFDLDEILKYTMVFSSNDGALAIADGLGGRDVFVKQMNSDAKELGLQLYFTHPAGLDEHGKLGGEGSALSVAKLLAVVKSRFPEVLEATTKTRVSVTSSTGRVTGIPNTNQDVNNFPGIEMSKTGYTDLAGGNLVVIVDASLGHPVAIVVLGSTHESRFSDVEALYAALKKSIE